MIDPVVAAEPAFKTRSVKVAGWPAMSVAGPPLDSCRSGAAVTGVVALPTLFAVFASPAVCAHARFTTEGSAPRATVTVRVTTSESPAASGGGRLQLTMPDAAEQMDVPAVALTKVSPAGSVSTTRTVSLVATLPTFLNVSLYVPLWPTWKALVAALVIWMSGAPVTGVPTSVVELLAPFVSFAVATVAVLFTALAAVGSTLTVSVSTLVPPAATGPALVQVTVWPARIVPVAPQLHPVPLADTKPIPAARLSVTVISPVVAPVPMLLTVSW